MNMRSRISSSYLRKKRRKWPLLPYKNDKWDQSFNQQLAMEALKKKAKAIAEETLQQPANDYLLSSLVDSFAAYDCEPTPCAYSFIIKTLITTTRNSSSSQFPPLHHQLTPILHRIQTVEKFHPPEQLFVYLIRLYGRAGMEALGLLNQMKSDGIKPDVFCYTSLLDGVISAGDFDKAEDLFEEMLVLGVVPDIYTYNVYINGLSKRGDFESAFKMLICMEELGCKPNVITYNTLIGAMCKVGKFTKALELLREMGLKCVQGNLHTYRILLDGLICKGEAIKACKFLDDMFWQ